MKSRLIDPIHVFDAAGRSFLRLDFLEKRVKFLEAQVIRANRIIQQDRDRQAAERPQESRTLH